jgi:hypothetical protein
MCRARMEMIVRVGSSMWGEVATQKPWGGKHVRSPNDAAIQAGVVAAVSSTEAATPLA